MKLGKQIYVRDLPNYHNKNVYIEFYHGATDGNQIKGLNKDGKYKVDSENQIVYHDINMPISWEFNLIKGIYEFE